MGREVDGQGWIDGNCDGTIDVEVVRQGHPNDDNPWRVASLKANIVRQESYQQFWADLEK